jgi:H+/gluconate symporter-like permease
MKLFKKIIRVSTQWTVYFFLGVPLMALAVGLAVIGFAFLPEYDDSFKDLMRSIKDAVVDTKEMLIKDFNLSDNV